ncbi:unnamed protein product [Paramecium octaurelia]|uniref:Protein kinase domain-containing protein n=1 Tax=Paramecium octaurelia TaxID=43137 RepID=A0A8S1YLQ1_PAROT|nr:unnamed protein product [Paramecium octaurelia]
MKERFQCLLKERNLNKQFKQLPLKKSQIKFSQLWSLGIAQILKTCRIKNRYAYKQNISIIQMAKGVSELHKLGFFHRDFKTSNFVMGKDNKNQIDMNLKTIEDNTQTQEVGTYQFMAPEILVSSDYDSSVGIWSLGMVFYQALLGIGFFSMKKEYETSNELLQIKQIQINERLRANKIQNSGNKKLLQKIIVQRLDQEKKKNKDVKRIGIDEVIHELEEKGYKQKIDLYEILVQLIDDKGIINIILSKLKKEKSYDCLNKPQKNSNDQKNFLEENDLRNIRELKFNKKNYLKEEFVQIERI